MTQPARIDARHIAAIVCAAVLIGLFRLYLMVAMDDFSLRTITFYKDGAHIFIGLVLGLAMVTKDRRLWSTFWTLNVLEVCAFLLSHQDH